MYLWRLLPDRLTGMCCNEVKRVLVNDTVVALICTVIICGIWVNVDFRLAHPELMRCVSLMSLSLAADNKWMPVTFYP